ncbi:RNA-binding protein 26 [Ophiophagus hannah]|uniref:RNA-binding protein 26 n=1 Tax=Ophiophagus hannah TaxID=8665 RepID=V8P1M3_OPHHA|nr:RNA-binding protein 26 [Ophiophagus hannah]
MFLFIKIIKEEEREKKFSRRLNHSPPQSSSRYRDTRSRDERKKDDRSRKRDYDRNPPRRESYRDRYNRRRGRSRSYSRSRSRSWSKERLRDRDRDRSRSRSRSRTRSREKGFCMRGDMCPFDHGSDPVVVEDVNLPGILPFPAQPPVVEGPPPPGLPPPPPILTPPPVNLRPPVPPPGPLPPSLPPVTGPPPPLPPLQPSGMDAPPNSATSSVPTVVTTGIHHQPPPAPPSLFTETYDTDGYNPEAPSITSTSRPMYRHRVHAQRPNLIGLTSGDMDLPPREKPPNKSSMRIVVDSESRKRTIGAGDGLAAKKNWFDKLPTREIQKVPSSSLLPTKKLKKQYQVIQPLVQQPILPVVKQSVKERLGPVPASNIEPIEAQSASAETVQNVTKLSVKDRLGFVPKPPTPTTEKVLSTSTGLTKTVYNPAALKAAQKILPVVNTALLDSSEAQKKKQEALRLQQDVRKKKQEILEKHIETQKMLISKLEKNKNMKLEDKAEIMKTLEALTNSITKLKDELKGVSSTSTPMQKELLDTELDLYKKMQAGEEVTELRRKYTELQLEQYGEIEDCQIDDSSLHAVITFKTRAEAEAAAIHGSRFKGQDLKLAWNKPVTNMSTVETEETEPDEEEAKEKRDHM